MNSDKTPIEYNLDSAFRTARAQEKRFTPPSGADFQVVPKNSKRIALIVSAPTAGQLWISDQPLVAGNQGIPATAATPIMISQRTHGDYATHEFHGWTNTVGGFFTVVEVIGDCSCPTANP